MCQVFREKYDRAERVWRFFSETARLELEPFKTRITFTEEKAGINLKAYPYTTLKALYRGILKGMENYFSY